MNLPAAVKGGARGFRVGLRKDRDDDGRRPGVDELEDRVEELEEDLRAAADTIRRCNDGRAQLLNLVAEREAALQRCERDLDECRNRPGPENPEEPREVCPPDGRWTCRKATRYTWEIAKNGHVWLPTRDRGAWIVRALTAFEEIER